jgi:predicted DNA-binding ribbon-helix-helix protein
MNDDAIPSAQVVRKRSVRIAGHRTSVSLEDAFWDELTRIAEARGQSINALIAAIDAGRDGNLSSAVRVFILNEVRNASAM